MNDDRIQCRVVVLPDSTRINQAIGSEFTALWDDPGLKRSHYFAGRYENLYVPEQRLPSLAPVLAAGRKGAAEYLGQPGLALSASFWMNAMGPGHVTLPHSHDEDDELVSGVYYISVPPDSGELILQQGLIHTRVAPVEGEFVFFPPDIVHEVSENRSQQLRLSVGMNFGVRE